MKAFARACDDEVLSEAFGGIASLCVEPEGTNEAHPWAFKLTTTVLAAKNVEEAKVGVLVGVAGEPDSNPFGQGNFRPAAKRPQTYVVVRSLNDFDSFINEFLRRVPFSVIGCLPGTVKHNLRLDDSQFVLGILLFMISSPRTNNDPLLWALLTTPTEEYREQFGALTYTPKPPLQLPDSHYYRLRLDGGIKPSQISIPMIESGMAERAFVSCDKLNACLAATNVLEDIALRRIGARARMWETSLANIEDVETAASLMGDSFRDVAAAFRDATHSNYWPWNKREALEQDRLGKPHPATKLSRWMLKSANMCTLQGATEAQVVSHDLMQAIAVSCLFNVAAEASSIAAERRLFCVPDVSPILQKLPPVETKLLAILERGSGTSELDALEAVDEQLSVLNDEVDRCIDSFVGHLTEIRDANSERLLLQLKQLVVQQKLGWQSLELTLEEVKLSLADDDFLDADLPIFPMKAEASEPPPIADATISSPPPSPASPTPKPVSRTASPPPRATPRSPMYFAAGSLNEDASGNPFDVAEEDSRLVEMKEIRRQSWKDLVDRPRKVKPPPDDPFA